jgi:proline racemase/trans-L-3-hydroxyproline dehydratase
LPRRSNIPKIGVIKVDIGYGGNFFTIVDIDSVKKSITAGKMPELREMSKIILTAANERITVQHPENPDINFMDQVLFCDNTANDNGEYLCQCIFGDAQADISPCGTGTSARIAQRYFRGLLGLGEVFHQKSIYGGVFGGKALRETTLNDGVKAVITRISCRDVHITGFNQLVIEENDALKKGFVS